MKTLSILVGAAALAVGSGCVEKTRYDALQTKYNERGTALQAAETELVEVKRREQLAAAERASIEREIGLLKARLEAKDVQASIDAAPAAPGLGGTLPAAFAAGEETTVAPGGEGWKTNPATGGLVLDGGAIFMPGSAQLRLPAAKPILDRIVAELLKPELKDVLVRIEGHTDDTPITKSKNHDNWELSGKRALAVLNYFEQHGVGSDRLSFTGHGSVRPLKPGTEKATRAENRRVEVLLVRRK